MYQVFNMGTRLEIYVDPSVADEIISISNGFGVEAQKIGYVVDADSSYVQIEQPGKPLLRFPTKSH
jgi:phosphoribosylformylglycinamidine cyclo-ligase